MKRLGTFDGKSHDLIVAVHAEIFMCVIGEFACAAEHQLLRFANHLLSPGCLCMARLSYACMV